MTLSVDLRERADALRAQRVPFVEATVVRAERPTSAKPGDAALVLPDGALVGFVGGTCAESTVRLHGLATLKSGRTRLLRIVPEAPPGDAASDAVSGDAGADPVVVHNPCLSGGALEVFLEPRLPAPLLVVSGDQPIAQALAAVAAAAGYAVAPAGDEPLPADAAAVVVASHGRAEEPLLRAALAAGVPYIALVASRRRGGAVLDGLGLGVAERSRIRTPAGLDIGARTPGEIAVSILAEIVQERAAVQAPARSPAPVAAAPAPEPVLPPEPAVDPVCGMSVVAAEPTLWLERDGERVWFCGPGCRDAFAATSLPRS